jgi:hypothetical protein
VNESGTVTERRVTPSFGAVLIFALDEAIGGALGNQWSAPLCR